MVFDSVGLGGPVALAAASGPDFPTVSEILPKPGLFVGTPFAINSIILIRLISTVFIVVFFCIAAARAKIIPGRVQSMVELVIDFIRHSIVYEFLGEERGEKYMNLIVTYFVSIFLFNFCENIPGMNVAATTTIAMPLVFAVWSLISYWAAGIRTKGLWRFLKDELFPAGVPWPIYILLAPINLLEITVIRPFSLTIRLFVNMVAGYLLVGLCFSATQWFFFNCADGMKIIGLGTLLGGFIMTVFEILIDALQAFIFAVLTASYIMLSMPERNEVSGGDPAKAITAIEASGHTVGNAVRAVKATADAIRS